MAAEEGGEGHAVRRIPLRPEWDATLTYALLELPPAAAPPSPPSDDGEPVFVGRDDLLGGVVNAIAQPDRRGTYLVSGYRGVGKTSLVIEAARRARERLPEGWQLLPIVLNVSEVSASLDDVGTAVGPKPLHIDARKLLTALLRELRNRMAQVSQATTAPEPGTRPKEPVQETIERLQKKVARAYDKAAAAQYQQKEHRRVDLTSTVTSERKRSLDVANLLMVVGVIAGLAAVALQGFLLAKTLAGALQIAVVALAGACVISLHRARSVSKTTTEASGIETEIVLDNSLHQLESDLKDILAELHRLRWRTIIVLEELDKVEDEEGKQLEAVIRYFKNLFTQAPALFFFLTDKQYFDHVSSRITEARRRRTYAVEHTFFTNRVFVNRPSVEDCLAYLEASFADPDDRAAVRELADADRRRVRDLARMSEVEQFLRVLMFRAQGHFFDLKNEMRRFVRVGPSGSALEFDDGTFPPADRGLAAFQFVAERCARAFRFGVGQEYADEALRSCLALAFAGMGASEGQVVADLLGDDALPLDQRRRIERAVHSLLDDLHRGGAFEYLELSDLPVDGERVPETFAWRHDAGAAFRPSARLAPHEERLVADLTRMERTVGLLAPDGPLVRVVPVPADLPKQASRLLAERRSELMASDTPLTTEEASRLRIEVERPAELLVDAVTTAHRDRLASHGFLLSEVSGTRRSPLWAVTHRELYTPPGEAVILAYGGGQATVGALGRLARSLGASDDLPEDEERFAVVVVEDDPAPPGDVVERAARWRAALAGTRWHTRAMVTLVPVHEDLPAREAVARWGERTADELLFAWLWANQGRLIDRRPEVLPVPAPPPSYRLRSGGEEVRVRDVADAVTRWVDSGDRVLMIARHAERTDDDQFGLGMPAIAQAFAQAHELVTPVAYLPSGLGVPDNGHLDMGTHRLMASGRVIVGVTKVSADGLLPGVPSEAQRLVVDVTDKLRFRGPGPVATLREDDRVLYKLADMVREGDPAESSALLHLAAEEGDVRAIGDLVVALHERAPERAQQWRNELLRHRPNVDLHILRDVARRIGGPSSAEGRTILEAAADDGDARAMEELFVGLLPREPEVADSWMRRLVGSESTVALEAARRAEGIDRDRAVAMYHLLAENGDLEAAGRLVVLLALSDPDGADRWLTRLAALAPPDLLDRVADELDAIGSELAIKLHASITPPPLDSTEAPETEGQADQASS